MCRNSLNVFWMPVRTLFFAALAVCVAAPLLLTGNAARRAAQAVEQPPPGQSRPAPVNGFVELAGRRYDEAAYACTHNAMASRDRRFLFPNQFSSLTQQLEDGIRAMMLDIHRDGNALALCHGRCIYGRQPLSEGLAEIRNFLDAHPHAVLTLLVEVSGGIPPEELASAFRAAGLAEYCHAQEPGKPWPLLQEMVAAGRRLVVLTDGGAGGIPWLHDMWQWMWDTPWKVRRKADFTCERGRGDPSNPLFNLNHFLSNPVPLPKLAEQANDAEFLYQRANACRTKWKQIPNFVTVDFYEIGGVLEAVNRLNGVGG